MEQDKIMVRGLEIYGSHGVLQSEKREKQAFVVDVDMYKDLRQAGSSDSLVETVDYALACRIVQKIVRGFSFNLLETLAQKIAYTLLHDLEVDKVTVRVKKPQAPLPQSLDYTGVQLTRERRN